MNQESASKTVIDLCDTWYMWLVRYAARAMGDSVRAEDLVQEVFMRLFRELQGGKEIRYPKAWTLMVLRHEIGKEVRDMVRDRQVHEPIETSDAAAVLSSPGTEPDSMAYEVAILFSVLTQREQEVLLLRMQAMKYREIASHLKISSSAVNTLLARALRKLQQAARQKSSGNSGTTHVEQSIPKTLQ